MEPHTPVLSAGDLNALSTQLKQAKDFDTLSVGIITLGHISRTSGPPICIQAFKRLLGFLKHPSPVLRRRCANMAMVALAGNLTLAPGDNRLIAFDFIRATRWEGDVKVAKSKRLELCALCNLQ